MFNSTLQNEDGPETLLSYKTVSMESTNNTSTLSFLELDYYAFQEYWLSSTEFKIYHVLKSYIPPVLVAFGTVGNIMAILVLRHYYKILSIAFYLLCFTLVNTLVLYMGCGMEWISYITNKPFLSHTSDWLCKVCQFVSSMTIYSSNWLVVLMLIDRIIFVCWPLRANAICTVFTAKLFTIFIYVGLLTVSIHSLWTYELNRHGCNIDPRQRDFQTVVWPWIAATIYTYVPLLLIFILLILLSLAVAADCSSRQMQPNPRSITTNRLVCLTSSVSTMFLILSLPMVITNIIEFSKPSWLHSHSNIAQWYVLGELFHVFTCVNYSCCHMLYFICTPQLRHDLIDMLKCKCRQRRRLIQNCNNSIEVNGMLLSPNGTSVDTTTTTL